MLALIVVIGAAWFATGCGGARRPPRPFPGPAPPAAPTTAAGGEALAALALALQGTPYANGGSTPAGFDCSGLVHYVFGQAGVAVPRSVRELAGAGHQVAAPRAGDLVFFAIEGSEVSHVGIATGPDAFVHAPSSRGVVRVERLSSAYWARRFAFARRIAPLESPTSPVGDPSASLGAGGPSAPTESKVPRGLGTEGGDQAPGSRRVRPSRNCRTARSLSLNCFIVPGVRRG